MIDIKSEQFIQIKKYQHNLIPFYKNWQAVFLFYQNVFSNQLTKHWTPQYLYRWHKKILLKAALKMQSLVAWLGDKKLQIDI
jgi:hypothetical protein